MACIHSYLWVRLWRIFALYQETILFAHYFSTWLAGEASIRQNFGNAIIMLLMWLIISYISLTIFSTRLGVAQLVYLINGSVMVAGGLAIYASSLTSHAISQSYLGAWPRFALRFCNFLILFLGITFIILVTSGEISWMTYLYLGIYR